MSMYRCAACGSSSVVKDTKKEGFSVGKAVAGGALFGGVGLVAGALGKKNEYYHCGACGQTLTYCMSSYDKDKIDNAIRVKDSNKLKGLKERYPNIEYNEQYKEKYYSPDRNNILTRKYIINPNFSSSVTNCSQMTSEQLEFSHLESSIMKVLAEYNEPITIGEISNGISFSKINLTDALSVMVSGGKILRISNGKIEAPPVSISYPTGEYSVMLTNVGADWVKIINQIRSCTDLGLKEAVQLGKEVRDNCIIKPIIKNISKEVAESIKADFESVGASVLVQKNENTVKEDSLDKLKKLKEVLDLGIINQDEYNQKREKLLDEYLEPSNCMNEVKNETYKMKTSEEIDKDILDANNKLKIKVQEEFKKMQPIIEYLKKAEKPVTDMEVYIGLTDSGISYRGTNIEVSVRLKTLAEWRVVKRCFQKDKNNYYFNIYDFLSDAEIEERVIEGIKKRI